MTKNRSVAFGGNSVSEHFHDPKDFGGMLQNREGPETCNTYNMLRLTEQLFAAQPSAAYADYYERALYNHILSSINPATPGYVYFTPIRPEHYRVYSQPDQGFWCCVGTGMENPGKYGEFIYAQAGDGIYVNLFIPSELRLTDGTVLRQETRFPSDDKTALTLKLAKPSTFTLYLRDPAWVEKGGFAVKVNGQAVAVESAPSSYAAIRREWKSGDRVEVSLPMRTTLEQLPDGSPWYAIMRGPILLGAPSGTQDLVGLRADDARMGHVAHGPVVPMDKVPVLLTSAAELPKHVVPDPGAGPMHFRLTDVVDPAVPGGLPLAPFFGLHDQRYQIYWQIATPGELAARRDRLAAEERVKAAREAATLDSLAAGEQQPEVEHDFAGEGTTKGTHEGRHWRDGQRFQYTLNTRGAKAAELEVTYWGGDSGRVFDILANDTLLATEKLDNKQPGKFVSVRYPIPAAVLNASADGRITIKFVAKQWVAGGVFEVRLMKPEAPAGQAPKP